MAGQRILHFAVVFAGPAAAAQTLWIPSASLAAGSVHSSNHNDGPGIFKRGRTLTMSEIRITPELPLWRRLSAAIGGSAEYAIAFALFAVCLLAGGAGLYLKVAGSGHRGAPRDAALLGLEPSAAEARAAEQAALDEAQRQLRAELAQLEQKRSRADSADTQRQRALQQQLAALEQQRAATRTETVRAAAPAPAGTAATASLARPTKTTTAAVDWDTCSAPAYPRAAQRRGDSGVVMIDYVISSDGLVLSQRITQSSGSSLLDNAAAKAIGKCRFKPATADGQAVSSTTTVRFAWKLDGKP